MLEILNVLYHMPAAIDKNPIGFGSSRKASLATRV
jgi:hypothetical protein